MDGHLRRPFRLLSKLSIAKEGGNLGGSKLFLRWYARLLIGVTEALISTLTTRVLLLGLYISFGIVGVGERY